MSLHFTPERLRTVIEPIFLGTGARPEDAQRVAASLVENNLVGHDSHGVQRINTYIEAIQSKRLDPRGTFSIVKESATTVRADGGQCYGQVSAHKAMALAVRKAQEHDMCVVAVRNCAHIGRLGEYAVQAAQEGFMGMVFGSGPVRYGGVAPYLGTSRLLNTNPIAWAVPAGIYPSLFMDYATSIVAQGKMVAAVDKGVTIPDGWLLDAAGNPTNNPAEQMRGGVMLPFGQHKGYCLGMLVELVSGGFTGAGSCVQAGYQWDYPTVFMAVNIAAFEPLDEFRRMVDDMIMAAKAARKAPGVEEILVPGEPEWRAREKNLREGISVPETTWERIVASGAKFGVEVKP